MDQVCCAILYGVKSNPQLHYLMETVNPVKSLKIGLGGFWQQTDEETTGDELSIIDNSSSTEDKRSDRSI